MTDQLATPYMAYADRQRSIRDAELRNDLIPAGQRLADATAALIAQTRLLLDELGGINPVYDAFVATKTRLAEYDAAAAEVDRLEAELMR